jgi:hypothetical protein
MAKPDPGQKIRSRKAYLNAGCPLSVRHRFKVCCLNVLGSMPPAVFWRIGDPDLTNVFTKNATSLPKRWKSLQLST